jgi:hypothetical protein
MGTGPREENASNNQKRWDRQTRQNTGGPVPLHRNLAGKCGFAGQKSDDLTVATRAESATQSVF